VFFTIRFVFDFLFCKFSFPICVSFFVLFCVLVFPMYTVAYFISVYDLTNLCHHVETQLPFINIIYSECVSVFFSPFAWHTKRMRHIILPDSSLFSTLPHKRNYFRKYFIEHEICVSIFSNILYEIFLILRRIQRDTIKMYIGLQVKYLLFSSHCKENRTFSVYFRKILKYYI
jgi:hypothetical protein